MTDDRETWDAERAGLVSAVERHLNTTPIMVVYSMSADGPYTRGEDVYECARCHRTTTHDPVFGPDNIASASTRLHGEANQCYALDAALARDQLARLLADLARAELEARLWRGDPDATLPGYTFYRGVDADDGPWRLLAKTADSGREVIIRVGGEYSDRVCWRVTRNEEDERVALDAYRAALQAGQHPIGTYDCADGTAPTWHEAAAAAEAAALTATKAAP